MRASAAVKRTILTQQHSSDDPSDDVFLPEGSSSDPAAVTVPRSGSKEDPFGTMRASQAVAADYREQQQQHQGQQQKRKSLLPLRSYESELAITNELLALLESFRTKKHSVKEMETMFDAWRRKAEVYDAQNKAKVKKMKQNWCTYNNFE